ncbi:MAG: DUF4363 family protein [Faecalibacterium sp.]
MKKILPFFIIIVALFGLQLGSEQLLRGIFDELETQLTATEAILREDDFEGAIASANACISYYTEKEKILVYFVPNETLHLFQSSIYGMETYATEENRVEALAEAARAHAQLSAISTLYFRTI